VKKSQDVDQQDINILGLMAGKGRVSSWTVCKKLYPDEVNPQNHLSSVIWRLDKLASIGFLKAFPHPTRADKNVYSLPLPDLAFSVDGTVFVATPVGGLAINCTYKKGCRKCRIGSKQCKLATSIMQQGLEQVFEVAKTLAKLRGNTLNKEKGKEEKSRCQVVPQLRT
jgi:hypothetical protein